MPPAPRFKPDEREFIQYVDHTALKACTTWEEIRKLCREALKYGMASVCIPSSYVGRAHEAFPELTICTVVGFPLGNANTAGKLAGDAPGAGRRRFGDRYGDQHRNGEKTGNMRP